MAVINGTGSSEKFDLTGRYIWNGSSWSLTSPSGTTSGADTVTAGGGNDEVHGGGGNDTISGQAGDDLLSGGAGSDTISGGDGDDTIYGGAAGANSSGSGNDKLSGGAGRDTIYGGDGNDDIDGGADDDLIYGEAGNDVITGGDGLDTIHGGDGNDSIDGGKGNDILNGDAGKDTINGGSGNDVITGGADADTLDGGAGGDIFVFNSADDSLAAANFRFSSTTGDVIKQFSSAAETANPAERDKVDLTGLATTIGHSLTWGDKTAGAYKVWYEVSGNNSFVSVDTSGDGKADLVFKIASKETLSAADFIGLGPIDNTAPTVTSVTYGENDGALKAGETITLTVAFSEAVNVAGGTPTLALSGGGIATYLEGTGSSTLTFTYTVAAGQNTSDLAVISFELDTATIKDAAGNSADVSAAVTNPPEIVVVDTSSPAAPVITGYSDYAGTTGDGTTTDTTITLTGTAEAGAEVAIYDNGSLIGTTSADGDGAWTFNTDALSIATHDFTATAQDLAGNVSEVSAPVPVIVETLNGAAVDGYIAGATVFADANGNGQLDEGEVSTTTDASGNYTLEGGSGALVLQGGTDISTGQTFTGTLRAPEGAKTITPLSTLVVAVAEAEGISQADAQAAVIDALGLDPALGDLTDYDPIAAALSGDPAVAAMGAAAAAAAITIQNTILQGSALLAGAGADPAAAHDAMLAALASKITVGGPAIDLTDTGALAEIVTDAAAQAVPPDALALQTIEDSVLVIGAVNGVVADAAATSSGANLLTSLAQVQIVVQTEITSSLEQAGQTGNASAAVNDFTDEALQAAVDEAADQVGDIDGGDIGTPDDDVLTGSAGADVIDGKAGNDTISGEGGNDTLVGGLGDDTLTGGAGVDTYVWSAGDGYDTILSTGSGASEDVIKINGTFYDYNWTINGADLIVGVAADENYNFVDVGGSLRIEGFLAGNDSIAYLEADLGPDNNPFYSPDGGNSRIYFSAFTGTDQGNHFELTLGTSGNDVLTDNAGAGQNRLWGGDGDDTISVTGVAGVLIGGNGNDTLTGGEFDDELRGAAGNDTIDGGGGVDIIRYDRPAGSGPITQGAFVNLSDQAATYDFRGTSTTVAAGSAIDNYGDSDTLANVENVRGSNVDDVLIGTSGANMLRGNGGDDILVAGGNDGTDFDFLYGGGGADSYVFGTETGETHIEDFELGTDVLRFQGDVSIASLDEEDWGDPWGPTTVVTLTTGARIALVSVSGVNDVSQLLAPAIVGTDDPDTLAGTVFNDTIVGGLGDDTLTGGTGVDTYVWSAGDGYDTILSTGSGASEDVIKINGTFYDYNWTIDGSDLIVGVVADGNYDFADVVGSLRIEGFLAGNDGIAYLEADLGPDYNAFYSPDGGNARIYLSALNGTDQGNHFELTLGTSGNDVMNDSAGTGQNLLRGGDGNDTISVTGVAGVLVGGNGDDTLTGGEFDDILRGSDGNDTIDGGGGFDVARYDRPGGSAAFSSGVFVNLSDQAATYDFKGTATTVAAGKAIDNWGDTDTLANIENVEGSNYEDVLVGTSGANTLRGNGGDDILVGGGNDGTDFDFLYGGGGADSYVFGTETGETHIEDFELGTDVLRFQGDVSIASLEEEIWDDPWGPTTVVTLTTGARIALVSVSGVSDVSQLLAPAITGTDDPDILAGTVFNDTIMGGLGDDTLTGGAGVDTYVWSAGDGYDTILSTGSGAAQDIVRIEGSFYDYNWSLDGSDLILGVAADENYNFADVGGSLKIEGFLAGNDSIAYLEADLGPDNNPFYSPDGGNARIYFSAFTGTDQGNYFELTLGTSGNDVLTDNAGAGQNRLWGGDGDDTISVTGVAGVLIGGNGNDTLTGGEFDDELRGAAGNDTIDGGGGVDIVRYDRPAGSGPVTQGAFVNLSDQAATYDFRGTSTTVAAGSAIDNWDGVDTLANVENVRGSNFDDVLIGTSGANTLRGDGGDDILVAGGNDGTDFDFLYGGGGVDSYVFGTETGETHIEDFELGTDMIRLQGDVSIASLEEQDWGEPWGLTTTVTLSTGATIALVGVAGISDVSQLLAPAIAGTDDPDTLTGTVFNDTLVGGLGDDTLTGGAGVDTYVWNAGDGYDTILSAGSGASEDVIRIEGSFYDYNWAIEGSDLLVGVAADDNYDFADVGGGLKIANFLAGNDSIAYLEADFGPDTNSYFSPGGGNARIYFSATTGTDQGNYLELTVGTSGNDVMNDAAGTGVNRLWGGDGDDQISVTGVAGVLIGGNGNDTLTGAEFDDELRGAAGNDTIDGGGGIDTVRYDRPAGSGPIISGAFINLSDQAATHDFNGTSTTVAAGSAIDNYGDGDTLANVENARGSDFDDVIIGTAGANTLRGNGGNDILVAGGNSGSGGVGVDFLYGGGGADSYVFGPETGETHIEDFELGVDVLRFQGDVGIAALEEQDWIAPYGPTTIVTLTTGATVVLVSVSGVSDASQLLAPAIAGTDDPDTLTGTVLNDTLVGGLGDDTLTGGAGVDTYVWNAGDGYDTILSAGSGASEDVIKINGTFYDYNWTIEGSDLIVGVAADDNYDFADVGGSLRIAGFFAGGDSIAYLEADLGPENNPFYSPDGGNARIYFSAGNGTDQGNYFELTLGTDSDDVLSDNAGTGQNRLWGGDGNDTISVSGVAGVLIGGNNDDTLTGGEFDDELRGGSGNDTIDGGGGVDIVRYDRPAGSGPITQGAFVNLSDQAATYDFNGTSTTAAAGSAIDNWDGVDTLANVENVRGSNFDDVLVGTSGANTLRGNGGNDIMVGGADNDWFSGGAGADTFVFADEAGDDWIDDFEVGIDMLQLQGGVGINTFMDIDTDGDDVNDSLLLVLTTTEATITLHGVTGVADPGDLFA